MEGSEDTPAPGVGKRIRRVRKQHGLTQSEFGHRIDRAEGTVQQWETGRLTLTRGAALLIGQTFGVSPDWIWTETGDGPSWPEFNDDAGRESAEEAAAVRQLLEKMTEQEARQVQMQNDVAQLTLLVEQLRADLRSNPAPGGQTQGGRR